jgi:hypothetical protein
MEVSEVKQPAESKDASGEITIGLWKFQISNLKKHATFQVDVDIGPSGHWGFVSEGINLYTNVKGGITVS